MSIFSVVSSHSVTNADTAVNALLLYNSIPCISSLAWNHVIATVEINGSCLKTTCENCDQSLGKGGGAMP
jgi:hypothetical protein